MIPDNLDAISTLYRRVKSRVPLGKSIEDADAGFPWHDLVAHLNYKRRIVI